jgi:hypothetical protein
METGISYEADCLIGKNFVEQLFCGSSWQQTQQNKLFPLFVILVLVIILAIYLLGRRKLKK